MAGFDLIVRAFFADGGLSAGLAKANAALEQVGKSSPGARQGLRLVEVGARQLAFEAAGLSGGIGQLARGLLMFGGGSALMLGAVAGIGAVTFAYRALTKDTREAAEEQKKLREELHRVAETARSARTPESQRIGTLVGKNEADFQRLNRLIAARQASLTPSELDDRRLLGESMGAFTSRILAGDKRLNDLYRERRALGLDISAARQGAADASEKEADALKRAADEARRLKLEAIEFLQAQSTIFRGGARLGGLTFLPGFEEGSLVVSEADRRAAMRRAAFTPPTFGTSGLGIAGTPLTFANIRRNEPRFVPGEAPKPPSHLMEDLRAAQMMTMSLMMMRGGGTGGALAGLGGLASGAAGLSGVSAGLAGVLGPVGLGLTAVGGIFSMFDNSEERRHRELIRSIEKMGKEVGLERVTVVFTGPDGHQVRKSLAELEESDAVERVAGPIGVGG